MLANGLATNPALALRGGGADSNRTEGYGSGDAMDDVESGIVQIDPRDFDPDERRPEFVNKTLR